MVGTKDPEKLLVYNLTREEAFSRSNVLSGVAYDLKLKLAKGLSYDGSVSIEFVLSDVTAAVWLDFSAEEVLELTVNGVKNEVQWLRGKLHLSGLREGFNSVDVVFHNNYANNGIGLHHFLNPEDGEEYLYTQFEPFYAHRMFPCFDQPDLKAVLKLSVSAPESWKVISNSLEEPASASWVLAEGERLTVFKPTARISTYLYAVCAGPFQEYRVDDNPIGIPIGFYCRKTLAPYFVLARYTEPTIRGFQFFNEYFNFPYPFLKYDQVFVPEFNFGAMENVGCVTYRDQYVFRDPPSRNQLLHLAITMLHEMSHMWFGDLVTMKWWDDLWLNESFADYISFYALDKGLPGTYPEVWQSFLDNKGWGYETDQLSTTHPVACIVNAVDEVETIFDGISYSKGAAALKQLNFVVGEEKFRAGLQKYMQKYQYTNATFDDLISVLDAEVEIDLNAWAESWIKTAGLNEVVPVVEVDRGEISSFNILQSAALAAHPTLRSHQIIVELFDSEFSLSGSYLVRVEPTETTNVQDLVGKPSPTLVILNGGDQGYVKVVLDPNSIEAAKHNLYKVENPLTRQLVYRASWDMVRDLKQSGAEFIELLSNTLPQETNLFNIVYLLPSGQEALDSFIPICPEQEAYKHRIFQEIISKIKGTTESSTILQLQKYLFDFVEQQEDVEQVVQWLIDDDTGIPGFTLSQGDRWKILRLLSKRDVERTTELVNKEHQKDPSDTGKLSVLYCQAASPTIENKEAWWTKFITEGTGLSRYEREYAMAGFSQKRQKELLRGFENKYFDSLLGIISSTDAEFAYDFAAYMLPKYVDEEALIPRIVAVNSTIPEGYAKISRHLTETVDFLTKYKAGKLLSAKYLAKIF